MTDPKDFVAQLKVAPIHLGESFSTNRSALESDDSTPADDIVEGYINNKSIMSFVAEVPGQLRQDVLNSTLMAQRVADLEFPEADHILQWYDRYVEVLAGVGWNLEQKEFARYDSNSNLFEMDSAVVSIFTALAGQNYAAIITETLDALKDLGEANDSIIKVFERNTHSLEKGNFQMGLVTHTNDAVSMQVGAFMLKSEESINQILFFKSDSDKTDLDLYTIRCTLNQQVYDQIREAVLEKLGRSTRKFIAKLPDLG